MDAILPQLASSIILALLSWIGSQFLSWLKRQRAATQLASQQPHQAVPGAPTPQLTQPHMATTVNYGQVVLHIGILQLVVNVVGVIVSLFLRASGAGPDTFTTNYILLQLPLGTLTAIVIFFIYGLRLVKVVRWRHLTYVALGTVVLTLVVNSLLTQSPILFNPAAVVFALMQTFAAMGIGGALAQVLGPKAPEPAPQPLAQPYAAYPNTLYPNAPYPYGARPGVPGSPPPAYPNAPLYPGAPSVPLAGPPQPSYTPFGPPNPYGPYSSPNAQPPHPQPPAYQPPNPHAPGAPGGYPPGPGQPPLAGYGGYPPAPGYGPSSPPPHPATGQQEGNEPGR